jgi:predicted phosphate transport protein (TIGR00153 family)
MTDPFRTIMNLFAKSPFKPLNEHAEKVRLTVLKMDEDMRAYVEGDAAKVDELYREISSLEHDADKVKQYIRENLPSTVLMPVDRTDILSFLKQQDDVANSAEFVAQMLTMKLVKMPQDVKNAILKLEESVLLTVEEHVLAANKIITMLDTAFSSGQVHEVQEIINKVDYQKHKADVLRLEAMKLIYAHEKELGSVGVYHLIEIVKELGWVAEHAESSSNRLRLMTARR